MVLKPSEARSFYEDPALDDLAAHVRFAAEFDIGGPEILTQNEIASR